MTTTTGALGTLASRLGSIVLGAAQATTGAAATNPPVIRTAQPAKP